MKRNEKLSFEGEDKESLKHRLLKLIGDRPRRVAAQDWGIKYATLNNYLTSRGSIPRPNVVRKIAEVEGVNIQWILKGEMSPEKETKNKAKLNVPINDEHDVAQGSDGDKQEWIKIYEAMTPDERQRTLQVVRRKGIDTLLAITDEDNQALISLSPLAKKVAFMLVKLPSERVREIFEGPSLGEQGAVLNIHKN